jgi:hypothetical protein
MALENPLFIDVKTSSYRGSLSQLWLIAEGYLHLSGNSCFLLLHPCISCIMPSKTTGFPEKPTWTRVFHTHLGPLGPANIPEKTVAVMAHEIPILGWYMLIYPPIFDPSQNLENPQILKHTSFGLRIPHKLNNLCYPSPTTSPIRCSISCPFFGDLCQKNDSEIWEGSDLEIPLFWDSYPHCWFRNHEVSSMISRFLPLLSHHIPIWSRPKDGPRALMISLRVAKTTAFSLAGRISCGRGAEEQQLDGERSNKNWGNS